MVSEDLEDKIGYSFHNGNLLREALTHSSFKNENKEYGGDDNERLEFFGDAILSFVVTEALFQNYSEQPEGFLTKARAVIVCEESLYEVAAGLNLGKYMRFGKGELLSGGKKRPSILSDALEALFGAIYLDSDIEIVKKIILSLLDEKIEQAATGALMVDYKTTLQEKLQEGGQVIIRYEVIDEKGPDHNKTFVTRVYADDVALGVGQGKTKKEAEQNAAKNAIKERY
ncbi:MAG: hypothetical protein AVO33_10365 [delta proteobacterium ML8_F1]|nr:MAG: hypothetical protein AVO33_10365 [delta proteobacterium ML8_F1]